jgi:hypothetical protein
MRDVPGPYNKMRARLHETAEKPAQESLSFTGPHWEPFIRTGSATVVKIKKQSNADKIFLPKSMQVKIII